MDGSDSRHQRGSLSFPYIGSFGDALALGGQPCLDLDIDDAWKSLEIQSPADHGFDGFHTSHDDLCAYTSKCPTAGISGSGGDSAGMPLARQFSAHATLQNHQPQQQQQQQQQSTHGATGLSFVNPYAAGLYRSAAATSGGVGHVFSGGHGHAFGHVAMGSPATPGAYHHYDHDEFADQLSALSSPPPPHALADCDDDVQSACDSDCGVGEICHDAACSDDPSRCCEDESCLQDPAAGVAMKSLTSEDAIAAAALTSFVEQPQQSPQRQKEQQPLPDHAYAMSTPCSSACMDLSLGPDLCISPQFLTNYRHIREAHNPLQPSSCNASYCPIDDPSFYQECHIRHVMPPPDQSGFFDNLDLSMMMGHDTSAAMSTVHECGAKFPNSEAMVQHFWNDHRVTLSPTQHPHQHPHSHQHVHGMMDHMPGLVSSAVSSVSLSPQDLMQTPSAAMGPGPLSLPDVSSPLTPPCSSDSSRAAMADCKPAEAASTGQAQDQKHTCLWFSSPGGTPCGEVFGSAADLHQHVLSAHTHQLKRDVGGTYSCGWSGCMRRDGEEKGGFAQKSKIDRHMQVHTGNKPFLCDICHQSFSANQALLQHKLIHEDSKPLSCDICGKTFRQHSALTMHIRTHTKVRPLKCPYCNKEFSESSNLSKHKRIHTGDGLYICHHPGCGKHFHRKDQLRRHSMQHGKGRLSTSSASPVSPTPTPA